MKIFKITIFCVFISLIFLILQVSTNASICLEQKRVDIECSYEIDAEIITSSQSNGIVLHDLKIKPPGGGWTDSSITAGVGDTIEFQVNVELSRPYIWIGALVELPVTNDVSMFKNVRDVSPKPIFPIGSWKASDKEVGWSWFGIESSSWSKTMTFKATVNNKGSGTINLLVGGNYVDDQGQLQEAEETDSIRISVSTPKNTQKSLTKLPNFLLTINKFFNNYFTKIETFFLKIWETIKLFSDRVI